MAHSFTCPHCGADVPLKARACPECGSDRETGWSEGAKFSALLPDKGEAAEHRPGYKRFMAVVAIFLVIILPLVWVNLTFAIVATLALAISVIYFSVTQNLNSPSKLEQRLYQQLVTRSGGNHEIADRLIEYEKQRNPTANRLQLLQNAIYRWDRDRRFRDRQ